jgi:hypothetical protein
VAVAVAVGVPVAVGEKVGVGVGDGNPSLLTRNVRLAKISTVSAVESDEAAASESPWGWV